MKHLLQACLDLTILQRFNRWNIHNNNIIDERLKRLGLLPAQTLLLKTPECLLKCSASSKYLSLWGKLWFCNAALTSNQVLSPSSSRDYLLSVRATSPPLVHADNTSNHCHQHWRQYTCQNGSSVDVHEESCLQVTAQPLNRNERWLLLQPCKHRKWLFHQDLFKKKGWNHTGVSEIISTSWFKKFCIQKPSLTIFFLLENVNLFEIKLCVGKKSFWITFWFKSLIDEDLWSGQVYHFDIFDNKFQVLPQFKIIFHFVLNNNCL